MSRRFRFRARPPAGQIRLVAAAALLLAVRGAFAVTSFSRVRWFFRGVVPTDSRVLPGVATPESIAWAVKVADSRLPGSRTCLMRSLTTEILLRLDGYEPRHRIGVDRNDEAGIEAHSWIEYDGEILIGNLEDLSRFEPLLDLDVDGQL